MDRIKICPYVPEDLEEVNASYHSIRGMIRSEWKKEGNKLHYHIVIPPNMAAELSLADREGNVIHKEVGSGTYTYIL